MPKATRQQQKMFFALCTQGGWDKDRMEERAKNIYHLTTFSDITTVQISPLIDQMKNNIAEKITLGKKLEGKLKSATAEINRPIHLRLYNRKDNQMQFNSYNHVGRDQGLVMYFPFGYSMREEPEEQDIDLMQGTGKLDVNGAELYHYDIFITRDRVQWMVDWSDQDLCWIAVNMATNETKILSLFGRVKIAGNVYEGLKADEKETHEKNHGSH